MPLTTSRSGGRAPINYCLTKKAGDEAEEFGIGCWQHGMRDFINDYRDHVGKK